MSPIITHMCREDFSCENLTSLLLSSCFTHRKKLLSVLHALHVYCIAFLTLYSFLSVACPVCTSTVNSHENTFYSSYINFMPTVYQPIPNSSVCSSFDSIPSLYFSNFRFIYRRISSMRQRYLLICFLLLLSGDVELNPGPSTSAINVACLNVRSATTINDSIDKPALLQEFISDKALDILFLTETWLPPDSPPSVLNSLCPEGFSCISVPRLSGRGGGIASIFKSNFTFSQVKSDSFASFEHGCFRLCSTTRSFLFINVYRPPKLSPSEFINDFSTLLESVVTSPLELILLGDFNFHIDVQGDHYSSQLLSLFDTFDLHQHITSPTQANCHTLDLLLSRNSTNTCISEVDLVNPGLSDHSAILFKLPFKRLSTSTRVVKTIRKFSAINTNDFSTDIISSSLYTQPADTLSKFSLQFDQCLSTILDKHAPLTTISCRAQANKPFITPEIKREKAKRSRLESIYRRNKSNLVNKSRFLHQTDIVSKLVTSSKRSYFRNLISSNQDNPKKIWNSMNDLLGRNIPKVLPNSESLSNLASSFLEFFDDKISKLCSSIPSQFNNVLFSPPAVDVPVFSRFDLCTESEIRKLILCSSSATCSLDVIPTKLIKSCLDALAPPITRLVNLSLTEGIFPESFKHAIVSPLIKKPSLPKDDLSSYRPISNLNFISKILEKVIYSRLCNHLDSFSSLSRFQSAYRKFHSTETALLRVQNDLNIAINRKQVSALILLDLSAAFDTIDHSILLNRLSTSFGVSDSALSLLTSYLSCRTHSVLIGQESSATLSLTRGVPQGSVLGPLLFTLYTTPISHIIDSLCLQFHLYADDTQLYLSFVSSDAEQSLCRLSSALDKVFSWFCVNRLSVNPSKTEYLLIGTLQQRSKIHTSSVCFQSLPLCPTESARNLGVVFDSDLSFKKHISGVCRSSFFQIRQLRQIRSSLDRNSAIILANSLVHSKLDYCNSLLYGLPSSSTYRLQIVQNSLARAVCNATKFKSNTKSLLKTLHWLPVSQRIKFKIAVLTFKTLQIGKPSYLSDLLVRYQPSRNLRSASNNLLVVPDIRTSHGRRSFSFAAPTIWNSLTPQLRSCTSLPNFCSLLKTHLFPP